MAGINHHAGMIDIVFADLFQSVYLRTGSADACECEQLVRLKWTRCADGLLANRLMTVKSSQNNYAILFCRPTNYELLR